MTTTAPYPTQLLLEGQFAAPEGPVDLAGMYLMHRCFRRDLNLFAAAAEAFPASDRARWGRIAARFQLFATVLHKHHHGEDVGLWPLLAERGDEAARSRLARTSAGLRDAQQAHLAHEESNGMTLVQQHLTHEDWERLDEEVFKKDYSPREVVAVVGWVASGCPVEALRRMPGANPFMLLLARLMARRFDRREARIFGGAR